uniref:KAT8 regulatory NSL complex subunit 1 n=1 Tax=Culex pipiens TaxID=7175 RepID=A0A8D8AD16_CULPI
MGLARRTAANVIEGPDAVVEMAPALTEPLSQSKLSSSATSGASPRTGGVAEAGTSTSTSTATDQQQQDQLSDQDLGHQEVPSSGSTADSGTGTASTIPSESDIKDTTAVSAADDSSVVDDIQNNNGAAGSLLKIDPDSGKDLIELALEQLHRDATTESAAVVGEGGSSSIEETAEIPQAVIDQIAQVAAAAIGAGEEAVNATTSGEPSSDLQQLDSQSSIISSSSTGAAIGLQKDYLKDNPDMEQMLGELASTSDMELLQVFKSLEGNPSGDGLCAELAGGLSLFNDVDVVNMYEEVAQVSTPPNKDRERLEMHAEIVKRQAQMQRKYDFLIRRLNKLQARYMGQHVSDEVAGLFEYSQRYWKKKDKEHAKGISSTTVSPTLLIPDIIPYQPPPTLTSSANTPADKLKPISANAMKTFAKRLEGIATTQCSTQTKRIFGNRYFQGTTGTPPELVSHAAFTATSSTIPKFEDLTIDQLEQSAGMLQAELKQVQHTIDSEATASSSGGESADEMVLYNNLNQQPLTIAKRAAWRWAKDRASVAARWTWLLAQISDLEYRIRQHNELHNKIKVNKGAVTLEDVPVQSVNGYRGTLPGNSKPLDDGYDAAAGSTTPNGAYDQTGGSCRTRPFHRNGFRKRKLLQTANLHTISKKAARPSTVKCGCAWPLHPCALCTGRQDPTAPRDLPDTMPASDRVALLDPCFHPVLSFPEDVSHSVHFEAIMRIPDWQNKMIRCSAKALSKSLSNRTSRGGVGDGGGDGSSPPAQFFSSGDEGGGGHKKYGPDGKRKYNKHNKLHGSQELANHKLKKSKSRRNLLLASNSNSSGTGHRKSGGSGGYPPVGSAGQYGPPGGFGATPGGTSNKYYKSSSSKYRKQSLSSSSAAGGGVAGGSYRYGSGAMAGSAYDSYLDPMQQDGAGSNSSRSKNSSPTPNHHRNEKRSRISYDIDNIVIHGMAAANKVEILPYKEIATPKWRVVGDNEPEDPDSDKPLDTSSDDHLLLDTSQLTKTDGGNSSLTPPAPPAPPPADATRRSLSELIVLPALDEEDISDETILVKHERALLDERKKFQTYMKFPWSRPRANRRTDSRAESSGANTPDPTSPAPPTPLAEMESNTSPACPSTPLVQQDSLELSESSVINALNQSLNKKERRRTVSTKMVVKEEFRRSSTPDIKEIIPPYESLQFPLADDLYEEMVRTMPSDHLQLVEDAIVKLTRPNRPNNNLLLANRTGTGLNLAPSSSGLLVNPLSSNLSTTSTTLSATEATDLDEPLDENEEELARATQLERKRVMERLLQNSDENNRLFVVGGGAGGVRVVLDDDDPMDDEETDTGESLFVEEDDPNDPEWYDRPGRGRT